MPHVFMILNLVVRPLSISPCFCWFKVESRFIPAYNIGTLTLRFGDERHKTPMPRSTCLDTSTTNIEKLKLKLNKKLLRETNYKFSLIPEGLLTGTEPEEGSASPIKVKHSEGELTQLNA